ncbi:MAG: MarR family transcriptional regulator [Hyphomicrobiales bacterium]|nr:MarR family transcriptional regulator [Hyphomicrobiales bacterium]
MVEDVVRSLGYLCLGTRLKRIGERLQIDSQRIIDEMGAPIQASQYPLLVAVDRIGPLSIGELAEAVGITQPAATRASSLLVKAGLLQMEQSADDQRRRVLSLTSKGCELVEKSRDEIWPLIGNAVANLCDPLSGSLLDQLAAIEDGLADKPLPKRMLTAQKVRP